MARDLWRGYAMGGSVDPAASVRRGAAYLRQVQSEDGGFRGLASPDPDKFDHGRRHPTTFFTALILNCLEGVPDVDVVRGRAAQWLLQHKSPQWSWNYWVRGEEAAGLRAYPDDLDDTVCALAALWRYDSSLVDGRAQAYLTKHLIATEVAPGGPYSTWLVDRSAPAVWRDVDIAVNANIGFLLSLQQVRLPALEQYIAQAIRDQELTSPYYAGTVPILYFLARWYRGEGQAALGKLVAIRLKSALQESALHQALLVTAALALGISTTPVVPVVECLLRQQTADGSWSASALYFEPPVRGVLQYAGSAALTTAFCLEALTAYQMAVQQDKPVSKTPSVIFDYARSRAADIKQPDLQQRYQTCIQRLAKADRDQQISGIATTLALATKAAIDSDTLLHLNTASIQGWLAYTIYDDFWDEEGNPELLGVANIALRQTVTSFRAALPGERAFRQLVEATLECVDGANTWEIVHARAEVARGVVRFKQLPDYDAHAQLAERSWGHMLAACGVLVAAGYAVNGQEVRHLQQFFHHFLIARQLSDDAHDWEGDVTNGRLTAVVCLLLAGWKGSSKAVVVKKQLPELREYFWEQTIMEVSELVGRHLALARQALASCSALQEPAQLEGWLVRIERSIQLAVAGRQQAREFLEVYTEQPPAA